LGDLEVVSVVLAVSVVSVVSVVLAVSVALVVLAALVVLDAPELVWAVPVIGITATGTVTGIMAGTTIRSLGAGAPV